MPEPRRVLHLDAEPGYRGGQRQLRLLLAAQRHDPGLAVAAVVRSERLRRELRGLGVSTRRWGVDTAARLLGCDQDLVHAHDARSHAFARGLGWPGAGRALVVHRRVDDAPHDRALTRWKYAAGAFVCVSTAVADVLLAAGVPRDRLTVIWSAVEPGPAVAPPRPVGPALRLVSLGALVEHKGQADLLRALAATRHPHRLTLLGDGPLRRDLTRLVAALGLGDRVAFGGDVGDGRDQIGAADAFVHPSRTEGLGTAVLDAQALARPVVVSRVGGLPEICPPEVGRLVPPRDPVALAGALDDLGELAVRDPAAFAGLGLAGRARVLRHHRPAALSAAVRAVYDGLG